MPRRKAPRVLTFAPGPSAAARAELNTGIDLLLVLANEPPTEPPTEPPWTRDLVVLLACLSEGQYVYPPPSWPLRAKVAYDNLAAIVQSGLRHLRRCPHCQRWFLATDARRRRCYRDACAKAAARAHTRRARQHERDQRMRVTLKGTKRTR